MYFLFPQSPVLPPRYVNVFPIENSIIGKLVQIVKYIC